MNTEHWKTMSQDESALLLEWGEAELPNYRYRCECVTQSEVKKVEIISVYYKIDALSLVLVSHANRSNLE